MLNKFVEDTNCLVIGPALPGHDYLESTVGIPLSLQGRNCPWNTCALWRVSLLGLTGFPLIGNGNGHDLAGGVEVRMNLEE